MSAVWIVTLILCQLPPGQTVDFPTLSFLSVKSGVSVSFTCPFVKASSIDRVVWFKEIFGEMPQIVGGRRSYKHSNIAPGFEASAVKKERDDGVNLIIPHAKTDDGGLYFCGVSTWDDFTLSNGTFLSVTDDGDVKVSVLQRGVFSVPAGASVTLQCSVLSERTTSQLQVLWFRAAPAQSHPQIIYTHHNSSQQCDRGSSTHTCVYNFSKNILSLNDTGTYYCAVVLCGKMLLGNGTRVQLENVDTVYDAAVICMGTALVLCAILISVQTVLLCKRKNCHQCKDGSRHDAVINTEQTNTQDCDSVVNYAALRFNERKSQRPRENRNQHPDSVYSQLKLSSVT